MAENEALKRIRALDIAASERNQAQIQETQRNFSVFSMAKRTTSYSLSEGEG